MNKRSVEGVNVSATRILRAHIISTGLEINPLFEPVIAVFTGMKLTGLFWGIHGFPAAMRALSNCSFNGLIDALYPVRIHRFLRFRSRSILIAGSDFQFSDHRSQSFFRQAVEFHLSLSDFGEMYADSSR
jgi:hypothetical protein